MITEGDIRKKAGNRYLSALKAELAGVNPFPLVLNGTGIGLKIPFRERIKGIEALKKGMKSSGSPGYTLNLEEKNTRTEGRQSVLKSVSFDSGEDFYSYLGLWDETEALFQDAVLIREAVPELEEWILRSPRQIVRAAGQWEAILGVLVYFRDREIEGLYLREVPLELPTKFAERNEALLRELLDIVLPEERINRNESDISLRYGLRKDRDFRFRIICDPADRSFAPFRDLAVLPEELALWKPSSPVVLIIENKLSFLRFPERVGVIKIWGAGKSVSLLKDCLWLKEKKVLYWGDLDPQGFEILSIVREFLPGCASVCMDRDTFSKFESFAVEPDAFYLRNDLHLNQDELECYRLLTDREKGRLEQERLPPDYAAAKVTSLIL